MPRPRSERPRNTGVAPERPGRRTPQQSRSRELVRAVCQAGRLIVDEEGPEALTTTRIAERAGVSVGSLYQYFENREAILAAIHEDEHAREQSEARALADELRATPSRERIRIGVQWGVERHRKQLEMGGDYYRNHHVEYRIGDRFGLDADDPGQQDDPAADGAVQYARQLIAAEADNLRPIHHEHAAFIIGRGVPAILRAAVESDPERLDDPAFVDELVDLVCVYLLGPSERDP